jgi:hypothetical protein
MFFMFLVLKNTWSLFIGLIFTIIPLLNFTSIFFLIKDRAMKKVLLHGPCKGGIYPLSMTLLSSLQEHAFAAILLPLDC